jgi:hypothetical protein
MKLHLTFIISLISFFLLLSSVEIYAQAGFFGSSTVPLKPESPLFGTDVTIQNSPSQNQRNIVICSAFNGWLYSVYPFWVNGIQQDSIYYMRSKDNGASWSVLANYSWGITHAAITRVNIIACGNDTINLKIFIGYCTYDSVTTNSTISIVRLNKDLIAEDQILQVTSRYIRDFALVSDGQNPASNSNPFSLGLVFSKGSNSNDSIVFYSSSDGGMSFDSHYNIASTQKYFYKVALSYGTSPSKNSGRYFAAWEEKESENSSIGHIYTAHSEPDFNSPFTKPVCLDSLDQSAINKCRNPKIACQFSNSDNDSSNLTEVIMVEKQLSADSYDTRGFYNLQATTSSHFNEFILSSSSNNKTQSDINFNPYNSTFMLTYYDSTLQSLPFLTKDVNLVNPGTWNIISQGYNDSPDLAAPYPKVALDMGQQQGADVWIKEGTGGNGIAMFDAQYSTYTGVSGNITTVDNQSFNAYPNPCNSLLTITFNLIKTETVKIALYNQVGEETGIIADRSFKNGKNILKYDVSNLSPGAYFLTLTGGDVVRSCKLFIMR